MAVVAGTAPYWNFPAGAPNLNGQLDMADCLASYLYFAKAQWTIPLLQAPLLGPAPGTNVFFADVVPIVALVGKTLLTLAGHPINPYGWYMLLCLILPGSAMTALLAAAGQRNLVSAIAGSVFADTSPYLLWRWGHIPLSSHFLIIAALALYVRALRQDFRWPTEPWWTLLLGLALLTNPYLFVMVGACWSATFLQGLLSGNMTPRQAIVAVAAPVFVVSCLLFLLGVFAARSSVRGDPGFGEFSMNLISPFVPQMSGLFSPLKGFRAGNPNQYEGFSYLGIGVLVLLIVNLRNISQWLIRHWQCHFALLLVFGALFVLALSNRIFFGNHLLLNIPLSENAERALAMFRSSGRFFWPIGYAITALCRLCTLHKFRPLASIALVLMAALLQFLDVAPLRSAIASAVAREAPSVLDRDRLRTMVVHSDAVLVFPTDSCARDALDAMDLTPAARDRLKHRVWFGDMEVQLAGAMANVPTNTVWVDRLKTTCVEEIHVQHQPLLPGVLYVYLLDFMPTKEQTGAIDPRQICRSDDWVRYCQIRRLATSH